MKTVLIRLSTHIRFTLAAVATLVFTGIFILAGLFAVQTAHAGTDVLVDAVPTGSLKDWSVNYPTGNPVFTYEEITSPYDSSTALKTSVVGNTLEQCNEPNISRTYAISGNTNVTQLKAYLAFTSTMERYTFPYVIVELFDEGGKPVKYQIYYGKDVIGSLYAEYAADKPDSYTELPSADGDQILDLSVMGQNIDFTSLKLTLANYACVGENSVVFDNLRVVNGINNSAPDTTPPVITLLGEAEVNVALGARYDDAGATAEDDRDGVVHVIVTGSVDNNTPGTYTLTYTATDTAGNESTLTRRVVVAEAVPVTTTRKSSGTRIGFRQLVTPPGQVLGASLNAEEAQLERYRQIVRLLQQVVELLRKLEAMK